MIRTLNFAFIAITTLVCLGVFRIAEEARIAQADLRATRAAIVRETDTLSVLGAEWAHLTQPSRIQALAQRHLDLTDQPAVELSSMTQLPSKNVPVPESDFRKAKAIVPQIVPVPDASVAGTGAPTPAAAFAILHTGT